MELCTPVIIYLGISALTSISFASVNPLLLFFIIDVILILLSAVILQVFCWIHLSIVSWILCVLSVLFQIAIVILFSIFYKLETQSQTEE